MTETRGAQKLEAGKYAIYHGGEVYMIERHHIRGWALRRTTSRQYLGFYSTKKQAVTGAWEFIDQYQASIQGD